MLIYKRSLYIHTDKKLSNIELVFNVKFCSKRKYLKCEFHDLNLALIKQSIIFVLKWKYMENGCAF